MKRKISKRIFVICSIAVFYIASLFLLVQVEKFAWEPQIKNIGDAFWYTYVTLTTLGYGDVLPLTWIGKFIGGFFVLLSLFVLSILIGKATELIENYKEKKKMGFFGTEFKNHIVIVGWDPFADMILAELLKAEKKVAIILDDKNSIDLLYEQYGKENIFVLFANLTNVQTFEKASLEKASLVLVNLKTDTDKLITILNLKKDYPNANVMVTLDEVNLKETFKMAGVTYVLSKNEIASKLIASYIFEPDVADFTADLLESAVEADDYDIQQFKILSDNPYAGKTYGETFAEIKKIYGAVLIGLAKYNNGEKKLIKLPKDDQIINVNDYIILISDGQTGLDIAKKFKVSQGG